MYPVPQLIERIDQAGPSLTPILLFNFFAILALVILIVSILVAWFSGIQRVKTWYLLQLCSATFSVSFLLLIGQQTGPEPPLYYCAYSAALIYAAPPTLAAAALFFVIELHLRLSSALFSTRMSDTFIYWVAWGIPIVHGIVFWVSLTIGLSDISQLKRDPSGVYCHIMGSKIPTLLTGTLVILFLSSMLIMEVFTIIHLVRQRAAIEALKVKGSDFPFHLFLRTVLYTVSGGFGIIMVDVVMNVSTSVTVVLLALTPLSVALMFGTQMELLRAMFSCCSSRKRAPLNSGVYSV